MSGAARVRPFRERRDDRVVGRFLHFLRPASPYEAEHLALGSLPPHGCLRLADELGRPVLVTSDGPRPVRTFSHHRPEESDAVRGRLSRLHEDALGERRLR